ncbi:hypothetical protein H4R34_000116 [Dimargaris verticillata]|uniref:Uncharacterized protein n=1 Tax=Dimargaris verticillata TaxID=2761393 RepID=A0A9W8B8U4_9FUNG|nr:hypothetical protein H4R34_000116 [Dimargaris verticillata]
MCNRTSVYHLCGHKVDVVHACDVKGCEDEICLVDFSDIRCSECLAIPVRERSPLPPELAEEQRRNNADKLWPYYDR